MSKAEEILAGLGGANNVSEVEPCITRLRVNIVDPNLVDQDALAHAGAFGVVQVGGTVQVVVGPTADELSEEISKLR